MGELIFSMLNNKWVVAIGTVFLMVVFIVIPEIKAEIERVRYGRRPVQEREK